MTSPNGTSGGIAGLKRLLEPRRRVSSPEACDLCGAGIAPEHSHVVELEKRNLLCACRPCYLLFIGSGAGGRRFRAVPDRYAAVTGLNLSRAQWEALDVPVQLIFVFFNSSLGRPVAFYPSPAGAVESLLPLGAWEDIVARSPALAEMEPDVEAALVRAGGERFDCYIVPIDRCYALVGELRSTWRGFSGGGDAHERIEQFFQMVRERSGNAG